MQGCSAGPTFLLQEHFRPGTFQLVFPCLVEVGQRGAGIILGNIPSGTAVENSIALVTRLRQAFGSVIAELKEDSSGNWAYTEKLLSSHSDMAPLTGDERSLIDAKLRVQMPSEIKSLNRRLKTAIAYVTHDQIDALTF